MRYAWIMLLLGGVVAQNQKATVETMTMEQIEARTSLVAIYSEHEAQHPVKVSVPKGVINVCEARGTTQKE